MNLRTFVSSWQKNQQQSDTKRLREPLCLCVFVAKKSATK
ncbi:Uncharacterized protein dnm_029040 [Desulfonema magnum]|uniref:Uncharacterized protein n=1 Tax=Desulfonema magnum TaxID=45655 RepID=A0A975GMM5_9BACT|nr:Uncharacterized protein dnm_029040 [Desulfonema magnum]